MVPIPQEGTGAVFANDENAGDKFADQLRKGKVKLPTSKAQEEMYGSDGYVKGYMLGGSYAGGGYPGAVSQGYARKSTDLGTGRASSHGDASMASFMKTSTKDFEETATELWRQKQSSIKATGGNIAPAATSKGARAIALRVSDASASSSLPQRADSRGSRGSLVSRQGSRSSMASSINRRRSFKHQDSAGSKLAPLAEESSCEIESQRADFLLKKALAESQGVDISKAGRSQKSKRNRRASLRNAEDRQRLEEEIEARYGDKATEKKLQALALARMKADEEDEHEMRLAQQADDDSPIPEKSMERPWRPSVTSGASTPMEKSMEKPWNGGRPSIAASSVTEGASTPGNFEKSMELPWWEKEGFATIEEALQPRYDAGLGATDDEAKLESDEESPQGPARYMF